MSSLPNAPRPLKAFYDACFKQGSERGYGLIVPPLVGFGSLALAWETAKRGTPGQSMVFLGCAALQAKYTWDTAKLLRKPEERGDGSFKGEVVGFGMELSRMAGRFAFSMGTFLIAGVMQSSLIKMADKPSEKAAPSIVSNNLKP